MATPAGIHDDITHCIGNAGKQVVVVLPDIGERYLSTKLFPE